MRLTKFLPGPIQRFVRERMTVYVYTYGFRPSPIIEEQALKFRSSGRQLTVRADYRTPLYDMVAEVVHYDAYQFQKIAWSSNDEHHIVDIGANVGVTALVLSQIPGAKVACFEPDPGNCQLMQQNLKLNGVTNVTVFQAAITNVNGTTEFQADEESTGGRIASGPSKAKGQMISVTAMTLERAMELCGSPTIDLLKCDCEGGEHDIVDQITPALGTRIRNISIEVHDLDQDRNLQRISAHLSRLGYDLFCKPDLWQRSALHLLLAVRKPSS